MCAQERAPCAHIRKKKKKKLALLLAPHLEISKKPKPKTLNLEISSKRFERQAVLLIHCHLQLAAHQQSPECIFVLYISSIDMYNNDVGKKSAINL